MKIFFICNSRLKLVQNKRDETAKKKPVTRKSKKAGIRVLDQQCSKLNSKFWIHTTDTNILVQTFYENPSRKIQ